MKTRSEQLSTFGYRGQCDATSIANWFETKDVYLWTDTVENDGAVSFETFAWPYKEKTFVSPIKQESMLEAIDYVIFEKWQE